MSSPLGFLASNTHLSKEIWISDWGRTRMQQRPFFLWSDLDLGAKVQTEIELLSLTKLCKNISPPWNLLNQQKIDAYGYWHWFMSNFAFILSLKLYMDGLDDIVYAKPVNILLDLNQVCQIVKVVSYYVYMRHDHCQTGAKLCQLLFDGKFAVTVIHRILFVEFRKPKSCHRQYSKLLKQFFYHRKSSFIEKCEIGVWFFFHLCF